MAINLVVLDGVVKSLALKYDQQLRPELRFTLEQTEHATDGKPWTLYLPCVAVGSAAERLASEIEDGQHVVISSGKLCYRKRQTKLGEQSRMEILVWSIDRLSASTGPTQADTGEANSMSAEVACNLEDAGAVPGHKARKPRLPKHLQQPWVASRLASAEN
jgi:hypothetical protein